MTVIRPKLAPPLRLVNTLGKIQRLSRLTSARLDIEGLLSTAKRITGLTDFGNSTFEQGLEVLLTSLARDANLHFIGRVSIRQIIVDSLVNRLLITETQKRSANTFTQPLVPPLIIMGLPRTGTTLLHRLLATDPAHHAPPYWELTRPINMPSRADDRQRTVERGLRLRKFLSTDLDRKHHITADAPEEDLFTMGATFESWYFWMIAPVYGYLDWYLTQDHHQKYLEYRAWLQVFQAAHPGRRLVLKAPEHTGALSALLAAIPEAHIIQTHRDPVVAFASYVSLNRTAQAMFTNAIDVKRNATASLRLLEREAVRNIAARDIHSSVVFDVHYDDLMTDPQATIHRIYDTYGLKETASGRQALYRYAADNPQGKHGLHRYSISDTGLDEAKVRARFAAYNERFGFPV